MPQVQVAFDVDANGILQVTAMDKTTGRSQSITIQGASTLSQQEISQMIRDAEKFAEADRLKRERVDKRNRAEALAFQAERQLREVALDYGMQFATRSRQRIEMLIRELRDSLEQDDERGIDQVGVDLQDALYDLKREISIYTSEEGDDDFFGSVRRTISGDDRKPRERYDYETRVYSRPPDRYSSNRPSRSYQSKDWDDNDDDWL